MDVVPSPGAVAGEMESLGDNARVLVSEPLQRNLEASHYLSDDQPARICHRIRGGTASSTTPGSPMSAASSSTVMLQQHISTRSPTRRAAASSSCPSPLSLEKE